MLVGVLVAQLGTGAATPAGHAALAAPSNLLYSTYYGGSGTDEGYMVAAAPGGGVYATGYLTSPDGRVQSYVVAYNAQAGVVWDTQIADSGSVVTYYIRADSASVYVVGVTNAPDLPSAIDADRAGTSKTGFITILDPGTGTVLRTTYLGDSGFSAANVDALDPTDGDVYVGMSTGTQTQLLRLDPSGTHVEWSILLGGKGASTHPYAMQADSAGNVVVGTLTNSTDFPTLNAQQEHSGGGLDTGITKVTSKGVLLWSTYLGGSGEDRPNGLDVDTAGNVYLAGRTYSSNFPLLNPIEQVNADDNAAYVTSYTGTGVMRYSTYIGGNGSDWFGGVSVAADGTAWVVGGSMSSNLPVVGGAPYAVKRGQYAYIAAIAPGGSGVSYATYLGGSATDGASGAVLAPGGLWVIGQTTSKNFPTIQPGQPADAGGYDAWVALLSTS